jgi:hypothetical protein
MALRNPSLFTYGYTITATNQFLPFKDSSGMPYVVTLPLGYYSAQSLANQIVLGMNDISPSDSYQVNIDWTVSSNTQNRFRIISDGTAFALDFLTGTSASDSVASTIGFGASDYVGLTAYTGPSDTGSKLFTEMTGYNYIPPTMYKTETSVQTISIRGDKETIVWSSQEFLQVEFKYEPEIKVETLWQDFMDWASKGRSFDFTPDYVSLPSIVYSVTFEKTSGASNGLGYKFQELLPSFPFLYTTGQIVMRVLPPTDA